MKLPLEDNQLPPDQRLEPGAATTMHGLEPTPPSPDSGPGESLEPEDTDAVTGVRLALMLGPLTLASFLIFLDSSIVSTVDALILRSLPSSLSDFTAAGYPKNHRRVSFSSRCRMVR